tara:strand:+ start:198 stop:536 length:339 start_codon:yes stop_codon:yes gene_type:complete
MTWKDEIKKQVEPNRKQEVVRAKNSVKTVHSLLAGIAKKGFYDKDGKKYSIDYAINFLPPVIELLEKMGEELEYPEDDEEDEGVTYDQELMRRLREGEISYDEARVYLGSRR